MKDLVRPYELFEQRALLFRLLHGNQQREQLLLLVAVRIERTSERNVLHLRSRNAIRIRRQERERRTIVLLVLREMKTDTTEHAPHRAVRREILLDRAAVTAKISPQLFLELAPNPSEHVA
jgi:hypothetical protein